MAQNLWANLLIEDMRVLIVRDYLDWPTQVAIAQTDRMNADLVARLKKLGFCRNVLVAALPARARVYLRAQMNDIEALIRSMYGYFDASVKIQVMCCLGVVLYSNAGLPTTRALIANKMLYRGKCIFLFNWIPNETTPEHYELLLDAYPDIDSVVMQDLINIAVGRCIPAHLRVLSRRPHFKVDVVNVKYAITKHDLESVAILLEKEHQWLIASETFFDDLSIEEYPIMEKVRPRYAKALSDHAAAKTKAISSRNKRDAHLKWRKQKYSY